MASNAITPLPDGYEIKQLTIEHLVWVQAIIGHTMSFDSPLWADAPYGEGLTREDGQTQRAYDMYAAIAPSAEECIGSGLSYGLFKKEWKPQFEDTHPGGQLRWDTGDCSATMEQLLKQMDFPLVSIAMTKARREGPKPPPPVGIKKTWPEIVPLFATISGSFKKQEQNNYLAFAHLPAHEKIAQRSGTHTRSDYQGQQLMKALAHHVMKKVAAKGYHKIVIQSTSDNVTKVWENPPLGYTATVTGEFDTGEYREKDKDGNEYNPFGTAEVVCKKIWVDLRPEERGQGSGGK
ncbi:hypothetical protein C8A05DRAFT_36278 [Staphylotrichum tortipilum]|uniref:Uncharacterized protein n=1 Tax=Staphylotrichum tortipilum TaxID=2831512 RepID=A0AAN6MFV3_9PEZI|nr:hypothetical protein C8A05DRAFT_36278 [Staphylotrichum longicolle]